MPNHVEPYPHLSHIAGKNLEPGVMSEPPAKFAAENRKPSVGGVAKTPWFTVGKQSICVYEGNPFLTLIFIIHWFSSV